MPPGPSDAVRIIANTFSIEASPQPIRNLLVEVIIQEGWYGFDEASEKAEDWLPRVKSRLRMQILKSREDGGFLAFTFNSSSDDYLQGSCFCEPRDSKDVRDAKRRRSYTGQIYRFCLSLSDRLFERLSGKILALLKVEKPFVSRRTADQGIDFFGRVPIGQILKPSLLDMGAERHMFVWIVGQSKHYPVTRVSTAEIRELVGSVELARAKVFAGSKDPLEELVMRLCDPIIYVFFTSGSFTRDSKQLMARSGVLAFEGLQIAQFIADHGVAIVDGVFDEAAFSKWLEAV